jgi:hypothetical protein
MYQTRCDCGEESVKRATSLRCGKTHSCGCLQREASAAAQRRYKENPAVSLRVRQYLNRAEQKGILLTLSRAELVALVTKPCHYCGGMDSCSTRKHTAACNGIDRIDNAQGYVAGNVVPCCGRCNKAKNDQTQADFLSWVRQVYVHQAAQEESS